MLYILFNPDDISYLDKISEIINSEHISNSDFDNFDVDDIKSWINNIKDTHSLMLQDLST